MSDVGGGIAVTNVNLILTDGAASPLPDAGPLVSGTFKPTNFDAGDTAFPAPAPAISGPSALSTFDGQNPNGTWNLWVRDEFDGRPRLDRRGWCLNLIVSSCSANGGVSGRKPLQRRRDLRRRHPVRPARRSIATTVCSARSTRAIPPTGMCESSPNPCADTDACTNDTCDEDADACVNTNVCTQVCNTTSITINDSATPPTPAIPYPSIINVSGGSALFTLVSVELRGITHTFPDDLDVLLSAPNVANGSDHHVGRGRRSARHGRQPDAHRRRAGRFRTPDRWSAAPSLRPTSTPAPARRPGRPPLRLPAAAPRCRSSTGATRTATGGCSSSTTRRSTLGTITGGWCLNYRSSCSTPADCNDSNACTTDACDATGTCSNTPITCNDDNACNGVETCNPASGCVAGTPLVCNDGNACNGVEVCDPATGCVAGTPSDCNDGNACNGVETCNPATGCVAGTPPICNDGNACNGVETCNPATGCVAGTPLICNDGNACNGVETCNPASGCVAERRPVCNDGNACNGVETCNPASGCVAGTPLTCNDGNACNGVETCNPASGCVAGTPLVCNDGNACNGVETCNPAIRLRRWTRRWFARLPTQCQTAGVCNPGTRHLLVRQPAERHDVQ